MVKTYRQIFGLFRKNFKYFEIGDFKLIASTKASRVLTLQTIIRVCINHLPPKEPCFAKKKPYFHWFFLKTNVEFDQDHFFFICRPFALK